MIPRGRPPKGSDEYRALRITRARASLDQLSLADRTAFLAGYCPACSLRIDPAVPHLCAAPGPMIAAHIHRAQQSLDLLPVRGRHAVLRAYCPHCALRLSLSEDHTCPTPQTPPQKKPR